MDGFAREVGQEGGVELEEVVPVVDEWKGGDLAHDGVVADEWVVHHSCFEVEILRVVGGEHGVREVWDVHASVGLTGDEDPSAVKGEGVDLDRAAWSVELFATTEYLLIMMKEKSS